MRKVSSFLVGLILVLPLIIIKPLYGEETTFLKIYESGNGSKNLLLRNSNIFGNGFLLMFDHGADSKETLIITDLNGTIKRIESFILNSELLETISFNSNYLKDEIFVRGYNQRMINNSSYKDYQVFGILDKDFNIKFFKKTPELIDSGIRVTIFDKINENEYLGFYKRWFKDDEVEEKTYLARFDGRGNILWLSDWYFTFDGSPTPDFKLEDGSYGILEAIAYDKDNDKFYNGFALFDLNGIKLAKAYLIGNEEIFTSSIKNYRNGEFLLIGKEWFTNGSNIIIIKLNSQGYPLFAKRISSATCKYLYLNDFVILDSQDALISLFCSHYDISPKTYFLKLSPNGEILWKKAFKDLLYLDFVRKENNILWITGNKVIKETYQGSFGQYMYYVYEPFMGKFYSENLFGNCTDPLTGKSLLGSYIIEITPDIRVEDVTSSVNVIDLMPFIGKENPTIPAFENVSFDNFIIKAFENIKVKELCSGSSNGNIPPIGDSNKTWTLYLGIVGNGSIYVSELGQIFGSNAQNFQIPVSNGTKLTLIASPAENFSYWAYECYYCGNNTTCQVEMDRDKRCAAIFRGGNGSRCFPFVDVPETHWAYNEIMWFRERGFTTGYGDNTFRPDEPVTRGAMAAFFIRLLDRTDDPICEGGIKCKDKEPYFRDVDRSNLFYAHIQKLKERRITKGWPDGTYRPYENISRSAMAAFLIRAILGTDDPVCQGGVPCSQTSPYFQDVPPNHPFFRHIQKLKELGITKGCNPPEGTLFCPDKAVTRAEMAVFFYRAFNTQK